VTRGDASFQAAEQLSDCFADPSASNPTIQRSAGTTPGLGELYLTTMDAIEDLTPGAAIFMVQGSTASFQEDAGGLRKLNGFNLTTGDGFVTDPALIKEGGLSDPRPFFNEVVVRPYASRTLLAPHLYPPGLSTGLQGAVPAGGKELFDKLAASWGRLSKDGYCVADYCHRFPVVIGEMGSTLADQQDVDYYGDVAAFAGAKGELADKTAPVAGWFWWTMPANSISESHLKRGHS